jgi:DNA-binding XRE family transcriptional regulator
VKTKEIQEHSKERLQAITSFLKEHRISNGYSQLEISDSANLSRNTIVRMESSCPENLTLLTVFEICDALELGVNQLFHEIS